MSPTIFRENGYRFYFLSNEEKRLHIHVTSEDGEAKYWLEPQISLAVHFKFRLKHLTEIQQLIEEHQDEIISSWKKYFG
jgi:hypothetical protein